jgi:hypothetical protein
VPYFSDACGMTFKIAEFEQVCEAFWRKLPEYQPRRYVEEHLSLRQSGEQYLAEYAKLAQQP